MKTKKSSKSRSDKTNDSRGVPPGSRESLRRRTTNAPDRRTGGEQSSAAILPDESPSQRKSRTSKIIEILSAEYPAAKCHLNYENPFQLLISSILAAQSTDVSVNKIGETLYKKYISPRDFMNVSTGEL